MKSVLVVLLIVACVESLLVKPKDDIGNFLLETWRINPHTAFLVQDYVNNIVRVMPDAINDYALKCNYASSDLFPRILTNLLWECNFNSPRELFPLLTRSEVIIGTHSYDVERTSDNTFTLAVHLTLDDTLEWTHPTKVFPSNPFVHILQHWREVFKINLDATRNLGQPTVLDIYPSERIKLKLDRAHSSVLSKQHIVGFYEFTITSSEMRLPFFYVDFSVGVQYPFDPFDFTPYPLYFDGYPDNTVMRIRPQERTLLLILERDLQDILKKSQPTLRHNLTLIIQHSNGPVCQTKNEL